MVGRQPRPPRFDGLRVAGREAAALVRQAALLPRDVRPGAPPSDAEDVVVLVHGLFASAGVLRPLRRRIEERTGAATAAFSYPPGPGVPSLAERLGEVVASIPAPRIHLVGHSLGGLVVRWFVQETAGDARVVQTISLATPFNGTRHGRWMPGPLGADLDPEGELVRRLMSSAPRVTIPHLSVVAEHDRVVTEWAAHAVGSSWLARGVGHNALLFHPEVAERVADRVSAFAGQPEPPAARPDHPGPAPAMPGAPGPGPTLAGAGALC